MSVFNDILDELKLVKEDDKFINFTKTILKSNLPLIGVKTPNLKRIALKYSQVEISDFIANFSYETNFIYIVNLIKRASSLNEIFLSLVKNISLIDCWALTDSTYSYINMPKKFDDGLGYIKQYLFNEHEFIIRYGYLLLFNYVKDKNNTSKILETSKTSNYFYVYMVEAWLISFCAIYNFETTYEFLKNSSLDLKTKLKAISKCVDSFRINELQKDKLKELRTQLKLIERNN